MNTQKLIEKHELATEILELIEFAENCIDSRNKTLSTIRDTFPKLTKELNHKNEITTMAIARLTERYYKTINNGI